MKITRYSKSQTQCNYYFKTPDYLHSPHLVLYQWNVKWNVTTRNANQTYLQSYSILSTRDSYMIENIYGLRQCFMKENIQWNVMINANKTYWKSVIRRITAEQKNLQSQRNRRKRRSFRYTSFQNINCIRKGFMTENIKWTMTSNLNQTAGHLVIVNKTMLIQ